jgi:hypothetical protein
VHVVILLVANLQLWLAGQVVVVAMIFGFSFFFGRAATGAQDAKSLSDLQRNGKVLVGMVAGLVLFDFVSFAAIGVALGGLSGWIMVGIAVIVMAWVAWNVPAKTRTIIVDAETDVAGDPYRVSAFFADVRNWDRWQTELISSVDEGMSADGPRFHQVGVIPGTNRQLAADVVLKVNEPGKRVIVGVEGAGSTADEFFLTPSPTGTHVLNREVLELPFILGFVGGMFLARDPDRLRRHTEELARAKALFEGANTG